MAKWVIQRIRPFLTVNGWLFLLSGGALIIGLYIPILAPFVWLSFVFPLIKHQRNQLDRFDLWLFFLPYVGYVVGFETWHFFPFGLNVILGLALADLYALAFHRLSAAVQQFRLPAQLLVFPTTIAVVERILETAPILRYMEIPTFVGSLIGWPRILQTTALLGSSSPVFFVVLVGAVLAWGIVQPALRRGMVLVLVFIVIGLLGLSLGVSRAHDRDMQEVWINVAAIQGDVSSYRGDVSHWHLPDRTEWALSHYHEMWPADPVDLVVFPEVLVGLIVPDRPQYVASFIQWMEGREQTVVGLVQEYPPESGDLGTPFLTALVVDDGGIRGSSRKQHLVPFSEARFYQPGDPSLPIETTFGNLGVTICYDVNFESIGSLAQQGSQLVAALFNHTGFGPGFQTAHRFYVVRQAAQYGIPVVMANEGGISLVVNQRGQIVAEMAADETGVLYAQLLIREKGTIPLYYRVGQWISSLLLVGLLSILVFEGASLGRRK